ncbi:hypothetical protein, partial [Bradyrhizobium arachidis]|uniref:hypothetical protein n=1 Tax=Bradyrhizobium arachidis TaxID=858423 RepID=UPI001ABF59E0
ALRSKQRPDTLMQDRIYRIVEIFLHPTAGPYMWVTCGRCPERRKRSAMGQKQTIETAAT